MLAADGKEMPGGAFKLGDKEAGAAPAPSRLVATFQPPAVCRRASYSLRVTLTDARGQGGDQQQPVRRGRRRGAARRPLIRDCR